MTQGPGVDEGTEEGPPITFPALRDRLAKVIKSVPVGELLSGDPNSVADLWTQEQQEAVTAIMRDAFCLLRRLVKDGSLRAATSIHEIEKSMGKRLGHKAAVFDIPLQVDDSGMLGDVGYQEMVDSLDKFAEELRLILDGLAGEFPEAVLKKHEQDTPEAKQEEAQGYLGTGGTVEYLFAEEEYSWKLRYGSETGTVKKLKGMRYLKRLLQQPGKSVSVLDLVHGASPAPKALPDDHPAVADELIKGKMSKVVPHMEKPRKAVYKAIAGAIGAIEKKCPTLAAHLASHVRTGNFCMYAPSFPIDWSF